MSRVFVDTSALIAFAVGSDANHERSVRILDRLATEQAPLTATSYVLAETYALLGRRSGIEAVRGFRASMAPLLEVLWVDSTLHEAGLDLLLDRNLRRLSLVDAVSFVTIHS